MPTLDVTSNPLTASTRLKVAGRMTRWFAAQGSEPSHVIVHFHTESPMSYFAGGAPLSRYSDEKSQSDARLASWASVACHIHVDRDHTYMSELAREIRDALGIPDAGHCLVRFLPTLPSQVFYLNSGHMTDSDRQVPLENQQRAQTNADD